VAAKRLQLERAQAQLAECNAKATEWGERYNALEAPFIEAKNHMLDYARQASMHEYAVTQYGIDLKELQRAIGEK
jgi:multidrug resistance efflux pump